MWNNEKLKFIIPARKGSKGMPHKNRVLVPLVINSIPKNLRKNIILSTDDEEIIKKSIKEGVIIRERPHELATDTASLKHVILDVINFQSIQDDELLAVLYPTYPERTFQEVLKALEFFHENNLDSMLCKKQVKTHPYMCMLEKDSIYGSELIPHPYYRRQDYPKCFEVCHYIIILRASEAKKINDVLLNKKTGFYKIQNKVDVDYKKDYEKYVKGQTYES